ncbi:MAG: HAD-IA family hydrolase, partial [Acidobacteria bacterium]|nr:HAD-IA family hydrolase [Acidobacteriota bacterium]
QLNPDPEIYRVALQQSGASPEESLLVDDLVENIQAAERVGIKGLVFKGENRLRENLEELGILTPDPGAGLRPARSTFQVSRMRKPAHAVRFSKLLALLYCSFVLFLHAERQRGLSPTGASATGFSSARSALLCLHHIFL